MDLKMEVYSPSLELLGLLEIQNSVIWERKAFGAGSFSLTSLITDESRTLLVPENIIWIEGDTAGIIEYIQEEAGEDGPYITVKGCDLTGILDRRILWGLYSLSGPVPALMYRLVDDCCIRPTRGDAAARVIPGLRLSDVPAGGASIQLQKTGGSLLEALEALGETYQVPFGVRFVPEAPCMEFWARPGVDRSIHQTVNEPVFYSTELDDVLSSEYSYNAQNYRNVALVAGEGEGKDRTMVTVVGKVEAAPAPPTPPEPPEPPVVKYTITASIDPEGSGTVTGAGQYREGDTVTLTAEPGEGYEFSGWQENGETVSEEPEYTFTVTGDRTLAAVFAVMAPKEFPYTGEPVSVTLAPGRYKLEVWGAQGGYRSSASYAGKGGYSQGILTLAERTDLTVRVGGSGSTGGTNGGFNGGGKRSSYPGGGGASDIRIGTDDVNHRVIVAGGGGSDGASAKPGKYGGGLSGGDVGSSNSTNGRGTGGYGGTQTGNSGGASWIADVQSSTTTNNDDAKSGFGFGGNGVNKNNGFGGAGGGGWYGGSGRIPDQSADDDGGGAGGSGFVWTGENAPDGFGLTEDHYLKDAETIDGSKSFSAPDGTTETGHTGDGYARITPILPPKKYTITVLSGGNGTATGGGVYEEGTEVTVAATPNDGYKLSGWMENGEPVSTSRNYTFTADRNRTLTAEFVEGINSRLPEGYTEVEYISTDGYARIPTGIRATIDTTRIVMDIIPTEHRTVRAYFFDAVNYYSSNYTYGFGLRNNETAGSMNWFSGYWGSSSGGYASFNYSFDYDKRVTIDMDCPTKKLKIGDTSISISPATTTSVKDAGDLNFGGYYPEDSSAFTQRMNIYSAQVYLAGTLKGDFIPCVKDDGTIGIYNLVNDTFYGASHGTLTAGPAV